MLHFDVKISEKNSWYWLLSGVKLNVDFIIYESVMSLGTGSLKYNLLKADTLSVNFKIWNKMKLR